MASFFCGSAEFDVQLPRLSTPRAYVYLGTLMNPLGTWNLNKLFSFGIIHPYFIQILISYRNKGEYS